MKKLPALKSREVIRGLRKLGFVEYRQKGSHKIFKKGDTLIVVPVHQGKDIKKGTLAGIIDNLKLTTDEFINLL